MRGLSVVGIAGASRGPPTQLNITGTLAISHCQWKKSLAKTLEYTVVVMFI